MTLQLYIARRLVLASLLVFLALMGVLVPTMALQAFFMLGAAGPATVLAYLPLTFVDFVPFVFPVAFLLALVSTYGRMTKDRELLAVGMAGRHPVALALPAVVLALLGSLATHHVLAHLAPAWRTEQRDLRLRADALNFQGLAPGRTELSFGRGSLVAQERRGDRFFDVLAVLPDGDGQETLMADVARLSVDAGLLRIEFEGAHFLGDGLRLSGEQPVFQVPVAELIPAVAGTPVRAKYFPSPELARALATDSVPDGRAGDYALAIQERRALSIVYFLFLLIGLPIGLAAELGAGGGLLSAYVRACGLAFVYYALAMQLGRHLVRAAWMPPMPAAWLTDVLFLGVGAVLVGRAWRR